MCAYLGRMFDLQRLKDMRAQLKVTGMSFPVILHRLRHAHLLLDGFGQSTRRFLPRAHASLRR